MRHDHASQIPTRTRETRRGVAALAVVALMVIALAACDGSRGAGDPGAGAPADSSAAVTTSPSSTGSETSTSSAVATTEPMDTSSWTTYTSSQYGLTVGYPPGWTVGSAARAWTQADAGKDSPGLEQFRSPQGDV